MHPSHQSVVGNQGDQSMGPKNCFKKFAKSQKVFPFSSHLGKSDRRIPKGNKSWNFFSILSQPMFMYHFCKNVATYLFFYMGWDLTTFMQCRLQSRLSKIFETFDIRSDLNSSNTQNSRSEHIWTLNFSIRFDSLRTSNISDISNIFDTLDLLK